MTDTIENLTSRDSIGGIMSFHKRPQKHIIEWLDTVYLHTIFRTNCEGLQLQLVRAQGYSRRVARWRALTYSRAEYSRARRY